MNQVTINGIPVLPSSERETIIGVGGRNDRPITVQKGPRGNLLHGKVERADDYVPVTQGDKTVLIKR